MGILDNVLGNVKSNLEYKAETGITGELENKAAGILNRGKPNSASCPKCGKAIPAPRPKFCPNCGAALMVACRVCKAEYPIGTKFCTNDGTKLG